MSSAEQAHVTPVRRYAEGPVMLLGSGNYFDFLSPETSMLTDEDVAYGLAFTARFRGQTVSQVTGRRVMYSVAEHCLRGCSIVDPAYEYDWLMHELGEVPWGDIISPQKQFVEGLKRNEERSYRALARRFGSSLEQPSEVPEIKRVDLIMLATERRDLMPSTSDKWVLIEGVEPMVDRIIPMDIYEVAELFLARMRALRPMR